jgi:signal peptidase I
MDWERIIVKRIVGLPGDLIEVRDGLLYRDGELVSHEPYVTFYPRDLRRRSHRPIIVKEGQLFVMGDNRVLSVDSKDFGPIPYKDVIGKAIFIYYPFGRIGKPIPAEEET